VDDNALSLDTPMMRQFLEIKRRYPEKILFFRMGDFYEMFLDDAVYASKVLDIALTRRQDNIPMCGVPHHSVQNYIHPILESGKTIAVCEQVEDPKTVSGRIVRREVVRILTPGTLFEEELLEKSESRLLAAIVQTGDKTLLIASADISTGSLYVEEASNDILTGFLPARGIREVLLEKDFAGEAPSQVPVIFMNPMRPGEISALLTERIPSYDVSRQEREPRVLAMLFAYLSEVAPSVKIDWKNPVYQFRRETMVLDDAALRTLEILQDYDGSRKHSLLGILSDTVSPGGRRLVQDCLVRPSMSVQIIQDRQDVVDFFLKSDSLRSKVRDWIAVSGDPARLASRLAVSAQVRHFQELREMLRAVYALHGILSREKLPSMLSQNWDGELPDSLSDFLAEVLCEGDLPPLLDERRFVKKGYNEKLDEYFELNESAQEVLRKFEEEEKQRHNLPNLKIRYNKIIGYYFEISKGQAERAPAEYARRQTLVNAERYVSERLKELEEKIFSARYQVVELQRKIFDDILRHILKLTDLIRTWGGRLATLDVLTGFASVARKRNYSRPEIRESGAMQIEKGRHPVVEARLADEPFVPNDVHLDNESSHLVILTGPNMSGKSTYIRQIGLLQIMAQAGSFVPASRAVFPLTDRIFTRIGAYDRLTRGESTFFVEMVECAHIFQNFSSRSLILLDEVGRGTSTYDGISIARAMVEYLNKDGFGRPRTLFATHYAELAGLISQRRGIVGKTVDVVEENGKVVFLRKIIDGVADKSYGIHVAAMAGIPPDIVARAGALLLELEGEGLWKMEPQKGKSAGDVQLSMF